MTPNKRTLVGAASLLLAAIIVFVSADALGALAGRALQSAGQHLRGTRTKAHAQDVLAVPCDVVYREERGPYAGETRWAETVLDRPANDVVAIDAVVCGLEVRPEPTTCPDGATCTGAPPVPLHCRTEVAQFEEGRIRVYCGSLASSYDDRRQVARIVVR